MPEVKLTLATLQERMTVEQYRKEIGLPPVQPPPGRAKTIPNDTVDVQDPKLNPGGKQRPSKYGAKQTVVDGVKFPSRAEADYYCGLKLLMTEGTIQGFCRQPEFILQDGDGTVIRYKPDFIVWNMDGSTEVIECKGFETADYKLREKLFRARYPRIRLVVVK